MRRVGGRCSTLALAIVLAPLSAAADGPAIDHAPVGCALAGIAGTAAGTASAVTGAAAGGGGVATTVLLVAGGVAAAGAAVAVAASHGGDSGNGGSGDGGARSVSYGVSFLPNPPG